MFDVVCASVSGFELDPHLLTHEAHLWTADIDNIVVECDPSGSIAGARLINCGDRCLATHVVSIAHKVSSLHGDDFKWVKTGRPATFLANLFGCSPQDATAATLAVARSDTPRSVTCTTSAIPITPRLLLLKEALWKLDNGGIAGQPISQWDEEVRESFFWVRCVAEFDHKDLRPGDVVVHTRVERKPHLQLLDGMKAGEGAGLEEVLNDTYNLQRPYPYEVAVHTNLLLRPVRGWARVRRRMRTRAIAVYWLSLTEKLMAPGGSARKRDFEEYESLQAEMEAARC